MAKQSPDLYFRIRDNGALVFRLDTENRHRRLDMEHVATVNIAKGEFKNQGDRVLTGDEEEAIGAWITARRSLLALREMEAIRTAMEQMNLAAQWAQSKATDEQLDAVTNDLLMTMHDLRSVLVRRAAERARDPNE
ncbi:hypothetical protein [Falsirhodobacter deserti]|uniref:hypothetical protein n=1 Tax=Falsirhodobacter deserti TaxID=1365611 RepID=UPI000FE42693|nr:hypothetical protein [Falsirhodobacter deserti]